MRKKRFKSYKPRLLKMLPRPELSSSLSLRRSLELPPAVTMKVTLLLVSTELPLEAPVVEEADVVDVEDRKVVTSVPLDSPEVLAVVDVEASLMLHPVTTPAETADKKDISLPHALNPKRNVPPVPLAEVNAEKESLETTTAETAVRRVTSPKTAPSPKRKDPLVDLLEEVLVVEVSAKKESLEITTAETAVKKDISLRTALNLKRKDPPVLPAEVSAKRESPEITTAETAVRKVTLPETALSPRRSKPRDLLVNVELDLPLVKLAAIATPKVTSLEIAKRRRRRDPLVLNVSVSPSFATTATKKATSPVNAPRLKKRRMVMVKSPLVTPKSLTEKKERLKISTRMIPLEKTTLLTVFALLERRLQLNLALTLLLESLRKLLLHLPRHASTLSLLPFPRVKPMELELELEPNT